MLRGPFKSVLVDGNGSWALELSRYIHLNPLRVSGLGWGKAVRRQERAGVAPPPSRELVAQRLKVLRAYRWSSYRAYAGYGPAPQWLTCAELWRRSASRGSQGSAAYRRRLEDYVRQGREESPWAALRAGMALGSEAFVAQVRGWVQGNRGEQPTLKQWAETVPWERIVAAVERVRGARWEQFRDRYGDPGRDLALWVARRRCNLTLRALGAKAGGMGDRAVNKAIMRMDSRLTSMWIATPTAWRITGRWSMDSIPK